MKKTVLLLFIIVSCKSINDSQKDYFEKITFKYDRNIYLNINFGDSIRGNFMYDTGGFGLYFDSLFIKKNDFKFKNIETSSFSGIGTKIVMTNVVLDTINFSINKEKFISSSTPIFDFKKFIGKKIDGIIGFTYFKDRIMKVNMKDEKISFYNSINQIKNINTYKALPLEIKNDRIYLYTKIVINDTLSFSGKFVLDTGCSDGLILTNEIARNYKLNQLKNLIKYESENLSIGGKSSGNILLANSIQLGEFKLINTRLLFSSDTIGALSKEEYVGIIGNKILDKFELILDPIEEQLYIKKNNYIKSRVPMLGFSFVDRTDINSGWIVTTLIKKSNADKIGIKCGDKIVMINNKKVNEMNENEFIDGLIENGKMAITISRDEKIFYFNLVTNSIYGIY
jgi:hypothetical protein